MSKTINGLTVTTSAAAGDFLAIWRAANGDTRKITKANFMGGVLTGAGTIATGGFTLTVGATSTINGSLVGNISGGGTFASAGHTLTLSGAGGTLALGGFTGTLPATGTFSLLGTAQTYSAAKTFTERIIAPKGAYSSSPTIADDGVAIIPTNAGIAIVGINNSSNVGAVVAFRAASGSYCTGIALGSNVNVTTGVLTGTTGADNKVTISAHTDGNLYIENRMGTSMIFAVLFVLQG